MMEEEVIQLPELKDIKEMLTVTRQDIDFEIQEDKDLIPLSKLLVQVIDIIEEKIANHKDLTKLNEREKIDLAAYLNFLQCLQEDFFFFDEEMEFEEDDLDEESLDER
jgi:hypothetical protein